MKKKNYVNRLSMNIFQNVWQTETHQGKKGVRTQLKDKQPEGDEGVTQVLEENIPGNSLTFLTVEEKKEEEEKEEKEEEEGDVNHFPEIPN